MSVLPSSYVIYGKLNEVKVSADDGHPAEKVLTKIVSAHQDNLEIEPIQHIREELPKESLSSENDDVSNGLKLDGQFNQPFPVQISEESDLSKVRTNSEDVLIPLPEVATPTKDEKDKKGFGGFDDFQTESGHSINDFASLIDNSHDFSAPLDMHYETAAMILDDQHPFNYRDPNNFEISARKTLLVAFPTLSNEEILRQYDSIHMTPEPEGWSVGRLSEGSAEGSQGSTNSDGFVSIFPLSQAAEATTTNVNNHNSTADQPYINKFLRRVSSMFPRAQAK